MAITLLSALLIGVLAGALTVYFVVQRHKNRADSPLPYIMDMRSELSAMRREFQSQVFELSDRMQNQLKENAQTIEQTQQGFHNTVGHVQEKLGHLQEATQNMMEVGKDIASLQDILRAPKPRGGLSELMLGELLRQIMPEDHFALQYKFQSGVMVDAVIMLGQGLIPVDAKFPLENFKRILDTSDDKNSEKARKGFAQDVRKHIDHIASKYILPIEGTFEFALMYIPAENVYYETIIKDDWQSESIATYALRKKVIPVSPNSFYAYLQAIVRGLKGLRIERSAQVILESLGQMEADMKRCLTDFEKVGTHLSNAQAAHDKGLRRFERLQDKLKSLDDARKSQLPVTDPEDVKAAD